MQFIEFKTIGTDERKERIEFVSDGQNLHFVGQFNSPLPLPAPPLNGGCPSWA
jgi:hypothetical protein